MIRYYLEERSEISWQRLELYFSLFPSTSIAFLGARLKSQLDLDHKYLMHAPALHIPVTFSD